MNKFGAGLFDELVPASNISALGLTAKGLKNHLLFLLKPQEPLSIIVRIEADDTHCLQNTTSADKVSCTIKNGLYHPWSEKDPSAITYYTLQSEADFKVIRTTYNSIYNEKTQKIDKVKIAKNTIFTNVVPYGENFCGSIQIIGKTKRPFSASCDFFYDNADLARTTKADDFSEQWLYLKCEEKDQSGKNVKVFEKDSDLLSLPLITRGCPAEYGKVQSTKNCSNN